MTRLGQLRSGGGLKRLFSRSGCAGAAGGTSRDEHGSISRGQRGGTSRGERGFTMIEMMVVLTIIAILVGIAAVNYGRSIVNAREAVLKQDLQALRGAIQQYTLDKKQAPQSLEELASAGYLREVPIDPITRAQDWELVFEDVMLSPDQTGTGLSDIHSNSDAVSPNDGTAYSSW